MGVVESHIANKDAQYFRAFVSYSHADAAAAQKLHRKIETYRLPKSLRLSGIDELSDGRLGKIFRDREDLPAAQDLSEAVKQALAGSQALIVLCSPDAKASPWVAREITLFRELHPDRPILAAILRGKPDEAFPDVLREGREPLAADLRKEGDGWRLGLLKIISGIAEVPLDALVQRDAQRRIRSVMAVTGGALAALLVMIGMTIFAFQQRSEAQHQQAEAEGMVEYMLTDLRTRLKGVGRLDVMTDVNERAMDYYEGQGDLSDMPAESLERRARILHAMGEDDEKRGDLEKALAKFTEAHRVTEALLAQDPENPDRIFGHAQSEYWVGRIAELKEKYPNALSSYVKYLEFAKELERAEPSKLRSKMEMAFAENNIGIIRLKSSTDSEKARDSFLRSIFWFEQAIKLSPKNMSLLSELANSHAWLSDGYYVESLWDRARVHRSKEIEILESLIESQPNDYSLKYRILTSTFALIMIEKERGEIVQQKKKLAELVLDVTELRKRDQKNQLWARLHRKILQHTERKIENAISN